MAFAWMLQFATSIFFAINKGSILTFRTLCMCHLGFASNQTPRSPAFEVVTSSKRGRNGAALVAALAELLHCISWRILLLTLVMDGNNQLLKCGTCSSLTKIEDCATMTRDKKTSFFHCFMLNTKTNNKNLKRTDTYRSIKTPYFRL